MRFGGQNAVVGSCIVINDGDYSILSTLFPFVLKHLFGPEWMDGVHEEEITHPTYNT